VYGRIGDRGHNVLFGQRLDTVGNRLHDAECPTRWGQCGFEARQPLPRRQWSVRRAQGRRRQWRQQRATLRHRLQAQWKKCYEPVLEENEDLVHPVDHGLVSCSSSVAAAFAAGGALRPWLLLHRQLPWPWHRPSPFPQRAGVHFRRLGGMNLVIVLVRPGEFLAVEKQPTEAVGSGQLKLRIHLDCFKRADFNTNLAAHADRNIDIEAGGIELLLPNVVRLLVLLFSI